jgi:Protein of unknown function (DUF2637)
MLMPARPVTRIVTRVLAVGITFGVGAASFALSFSALRDLAISGRVPAGQAWLWPLMVDGAVLLATVGLVVMAGDAQCRKDRRFFWLVLGGGAAVSIACNALHAIVPPGQPLNAWLRGFVAALAPVWLVATTHGLTLLLTRTRHSVSGAVPTSVVARGADLDAEPIGDIDDGMHALGVGRRRAEVSNEVVAAAPERDSSDPGPDAVGAETRWQVMAPTLLEQLSLKNTGRTDVALVLYLSYERALADREIGRRLGLDHHTVGKIVRAADAHVRREHHERVLAAP